VVGTVGGQLCDLDARSFISGKIIRQRPQSVGTTSSLVVKRAAGRDVTIAKGAQVGTVIVGFACQGYMGKAIVGGICLAALEGFPAGCLVSEQPLVRSSFDAIDMDGYEPLRTVYVNLLADETIQVMGMEPPAVLCADGNPLKQLGKGDLVHIRVLQKAVGVLRIVAKKN